MPSQRPAHTGAKKEGAEQRERVQNAAQSDRGGMTTAREGWYPRRQLILAIRNGGSATGKIPPRKAHRPTVSRRGNLVSVLVAALYLRGDRAAAIAAPGNPFSGLNALKRAALRADVSPRRRKLEDDRAPLGVEREIESSEGTFGVFPTRMPDFAGGILRGLGRRRRLFCSYDHVWTRCRAQITAMRGRRDDWRTQTGSDAVVRRFSRRAATPYVPTPLVEGAHGRSCRSVRASWLSAPRLFSRFFDTRRYDGCVSPPTRARYPSRCLRGAKNETGRTDAARRG